jgi:hypothetical protein
MIEFTRYYGRFNDFRGSLGGLPAWARGIVTIAAVPGAILLALSIVMFLVSLSALLLLTVPVYSLLRNLTAASSGTAPTDLSPSSPGAKRVEATVLPDPAPDRPV